jgi:D-inositol-3-phosphate glycosyltransferase
MSTAAPRVAMVSLHTSPVAQPGSGDSGGMNVSILSLAEQLARRGATVDLITRAAAEPGQRTLFDGVTLHELAAGPRGQLGREQLAAAADEFGEGVAALAGRRSRRYDVIHSHYWLSGLATLPVALELGLPFVQSFHTLAAMKNATGSAEPERRVLTERYLANQVTAIVAGSAAEATALIDLARAPADRVWVVPPGVDVDLFTPRRATAAAVSIRAGFSIAPGRPIVAVVGRLQPLKDQELAIRAFIGAKSDAVMVIAGEATPGDEGYLERLKALGGEVRFVGALSRERLADLLAAASITVLPSQSETFGIVALESAASGTPVIAFKGSGMLESVADGVSGQLIASRDPQEWAAAIHLMLADPIRLAALSASARHFAEPNTWAASATAMLALYSSLIESADAQSAGRP